MRKSEIILEGIVSVECAIRAKHRAAIKVFIDKAKHHKRDRKILHFISFLKEEKTEYTLCDREYIDSICEGGTHGGVAAIVSERSYCDFKELINSLSEGEYAVFLDGVEDPFNFGYSIRNLFAFGCRGFIIPERNWMSASGLVAKSSAGASELCEMAIAPQNDLDTVDILKQCGVSIVCSALSPTSIPLYSFKPKKPFVLFIGGEKRGISKDIFENTDLTVHIPYDNEKARYSLPTASCAAIFGSHLSSLNN